jgi:S-adenosylmethionine synthetase
VRDAAHHGLCVVAGEITTSAYVDIPKLARETINSIGYDNALYGFDGNTCGVIVSIDEQSPTSRRASTRARSSAAARRARTTSTARAPATRG